MKAKQLDETTWAVVFDRDDEAMAGLEAFAREHGVAAAGFTAIGAFSEATLAYFDWEDKSYHDIPVREQVEVLSLLGDIAVADGEPKVHAHAVLGKRDGSTVGGHFQSGRVRPTLEVVVTVVPAHLRKRHDPDTGLALIDLSG
jgi:predicted DNA-binding protein with PD1-like motif